MSIAIDLERPDDISDEEWDHLCEQLLSNVKDETPVKTGKLKSGWRVDGDTLTNDTEYAEFVNDGTSRQSAQDMTGSAVARFEQMARFLSKAKSK